MDRGWPEKDSTRLRGARFIPGDSALSVCEPGTRRQTVDQREQGRARGAEAVAGAAALARAPAQRGGLVPVLQEPADQVRHTRNQRPVRRVYPQPQAALKWIQKAIEHAEEPDATLFDHLGDIFAALKKQEQAREAWQRAYAIEPSDEIQRKLNAVTTPGEAPR